MMDALHLSSSVVAKFPLIEAISQRQLQKMQIMLKIAFLE